MSEYAMSQGRTSDKRAMNRIRVLLDIEKTGCIPHSGYSPLFVAAI